MMAVLPLRRAEARLLVRLETLEARVDAGDGDAWRDYCETVTALATLAAAAERRGDLLSTRQLAERLNVCTKTILRRRKRGELQPAAVNGQRGRAALRWRAPA